MKRRTIIAKAERLYRSYRVILLSGTNALVIGDRDTYDVTKFRPPDLWPEKNKVERRTKGC